MTIEDLLHPWLDSYFASPQWFKNSVGRAYAMVSALRTRSPDYRQFQGQANCRQASLLAQLERSKLRATLRIALESVPAYTAFRHLRQDLEDPHAVLAALPLVTKDEIRHEPTRYLSVQARPRQRLKVRTGGTTALPLEFYLQRGVTRIREYAFMHAFHALAGMTGRPIVLALRGRTVPTARRSGGPLWMLEPIKQELILSSDHLVDTCMPAYVEAMRRWRPVHIQAYPSALHPLARWLQAHPAPDVTNRIRSIMLFSESVFDHHLRLLRAVFPCPILQHYGQSERVLMATSMPDDDRSFFWPQYGHMELVDAAGRPVTRPGDLGEIVGTAFDNDVMPFIRYRTGDMAILGAIPHPHLPGYPVVERIEGRRQEFIVCHDRRLVSVNSLTTQRYPDLEAVDAIQFEQHMPGHFTIRVVSTPHLPAAARKRVVQALAMKTQGGCTVSLEQVESIPRTARGKHRMLIQHLNLGTFFSTGMGEAPPEAT